MSGLYNLNKKTKKLISVILVVLTLTVYGLGFFARPRPASAIFGMGDITFDINQLATFVWEKTQAAVKYAWDHGAAVAYKNALRTFTQRIAYDMAVYVGSGGQGQKPMFVTQPFGKYLENVGYDAAGDFLDTLAKESGFLKQGLCQPIDLRTQLTITMPLFNEIQPRKPTCNLKDIQKNLEQSWGQAKAYYGDLSLKDYQQFFDTKQNDLGIAFSIQEEFGKETEKSKEIAKTESQINQGFKSLVTSISGDIKTPGQLILKGTSNAIETSTYPEDSTGDIIADALGVFTNTLASRLQKQFFKKGLNPNPAGTGPSSALGYGSTSGSVTGGVQYAVQINSSISTPQLVSNAGQTDVVSELLNCPDVRYASVDNCTINQKMGEVLRKADEGQALTVREAINQNYLDQNWQFLGTRPLDAREPKAWYLTDLRKLRRARIIPIGWEFAAEKFSGRTLKYVMDGFNNCGTDASGNLIDERCHLIDPDWVLRAPPAQCRIQAAGQILQPQGPNRQDTCVDTEQCVSENDDGSCNAWGYCLAEKNTWRFSGDSCEMPAGSGRAPYATCRSFTTKAGTPINLLTNSLQDYDGICNASSAGCRWYSSKPQDTDTVSSIARYSSLESDKIYLKNLDKLNCSANELGCTALWRASNINDTDLVAKGALGDLPIERLVNYVTATSGEQYNNYARISKIYLREAPVHLNCYDVNGAGEAVVANDSPQCKNYASLCSKREVGCELYTPTDGAPAVPAVVQPEDYCPEACGGLNRFTQAACFFEPMPVNPNNDFIPSTAKTCPAQASGCEEFTNLDQSSAQGEKKEYYAELRQCIAADAPEAGVYYTWYGSDLTGFQLKTWNLQARAGNEGPATTDNSWNSTTCGNSDHTDFNSDPDCKEFYDINGSTYYRYASKTITAAANCNRYRATNVTETACAATNGVWEDLACLYRAIPDEGKKCEARYNGCREYLGPTSAASQLLFPVSTFGDTEEINNYPVDASLTSGWTSGQNVKESLSPTGHSYASGITPAVTRIIPKGVAIVGHNYLFTFWAKRYTTVNNLVIDSAPAGSYEWNLDLASIGLSDDWREYRVEKVLNPTNTTELNAINSVGVFLRLAGPYSFVLDNIVVRDISDTFYAVKNSWVTPPICEVPRFLGCKRYINRTNQSVFVTGFSSLCRTEAVGCEALVNTQNSDSPQSTTVVSGTEIITTPADELVYRVYDQAKSCNAAAESCRLIGQPITDISGNVTGWGDKLVKLDPDKIDPSTNSASPLCERSQDGCEQFTSDDGTHFFKDPGEGLCEYRQSEDRWYKTGTSELCNHLPNPSFENQNDHGNNLIINSGFENVTLDGWILSAVTAWGLATDQAHLGVQSVMNNTETGGHYLRQVVRVIPKQVYTARVWTKSNSTVRRILHVSGCGVNLSDSSQNVGAWEKLQITYIPTTTACTFELSTAAGTGIVYFDDASVLLAESYPGWFRNGLGASALGTALTTFSAVDSTPGKYWGGKVLEIESTDEQYSGIWSDAVDVGVKNEPRYFTISANIYVPDIPQNANMLYWNVSQHAMPNIGCAIRASTGQFTCHHYDFVSPATYWADSTVGPADKGKWMHKKFIIKTDPGVRYLAVGVITNEQQPSCTADGCRANQVVYVDQVSITEGSIEQSYSCPGEASGCTAFRDPQLTQRIYYYLDNSKLDKSSCNGLVSEKGGCLLFTNYSSATLKYSANATYALSRKQGGVAVAPIASQVCLDTPKCLTASSNYCSNDATKSCTVDTVVADCGSAPTCQADTTQFCSNNPVQTCTTANNCLSGVTCNNIYPQGLCSGDDVTSCDPTQPPERDICRLKHWGFCDPTGVSEGNCSNNPTRVCTSNTPTDLINQCGIVCAANPTKYCSNNLTQICNTTTDCGVAPECRASGTKYCSNNTSKTCTEATVTADCGTATCLSGDLDSNIIMKVGRSRTCSEWLSCQSESITFDAQSGKARSICYALGRCDQFGTGSNKCTSWKASLDPEPLDVSAYQARSVDFASSDYSGYSIPHQYSLDVLSQKNYSAVPTKEDIRLTYINKYPKACSGGVDEGKPCTVSSDCVAGSCVSTLKCGGTGTSCTAFGDTGLPCSATSPCLYADLGIDGTGPGDNNKNTLPKICRAYPQPDAPFISQLATFDSDGNIKSREAGFKDANVCQPGEDCECNYKQIKYSNGESRYYSFNNNIIPSPIVTEQDDPNTEDNEEIKSYKKQEDLFLGLRGYCLEKDDSRSINARRDRACLTWLPLDVLGGEVSIYDYAVTAGLQKDNLQYCLSAQGTGRNSSSPYYNQIFPEYTLGCPEGSHCDCSDNNGCNTTYIALWPLSSNIPFNDIDRIYITGSSANCVDGTLSDPDVSTFRPSQLSSLNYCSGSSIFCWEKVKVGTQDALRWRNKVPNTEGCDTIMYDILVDNYNNPTQALGFIAHYNDDTGGGLEWARIILVIHYREYCSTIASTSKPFTSRILLQKDINNILYNPNVTTSEGLFGNIIGSTSKAVAINNGLNPAWFIGDQTGATSAPYAYDSRSLKGGMCIGWPLPTAVNGGEEGAPCVDKSGCKSGICTGASKPKSGNLADIPAGGYVVGQELLKQLFAKIYNVASLSINNSYVPIIGSGHDYSLDGVNSLRAPFDSLLGVPDKPDVREVKFDKEKRVNYEGNIGFTLTSDFGSINSSEGKELIVTSPTAITAQFYGYNANGEQMPLTEVRVDWVGDYQNAAGAQGKYKNHKHMCQPSMLTSSKVCSTGSQCGYDISLDAKICNTNVDCFKEGGADDVTMICSEKRCVAGDPGAIGRFCTQDVGTFSTYCSTGVVDNGGCGLTAPIGACKSVSEGIPNPAYNFGDTPQACIDDSVESMGYFKFTKVFICSVDGAGLPPCASVSGNKACWSDTLQACIYKPRVYVEDNWEWCSTGINGPSCDPSNPAAWLNLSGAGKIIVYP